MKWVGEKRGPLDGMRGGSRAAEEPGRAEMAPAAVLSKVLIGFRV